MPDISLCTNIDCPLNKSCYRYQAKASHIMQSYNLFEPNKGGKTCEYFIEIKNKKK